jgi:signal transduction histidine kinase
VVIQIKQWQPALAGLRRATGPPLRLPRRGWLTDAGIALAGALVIAAGSGASAEASGTQSGGSSSRVADILIAFVIALPLMVRRRYPLTGFWLVLLATHLAHHSSATDPTFAVLVCVLATYSAAMYSPYPAAAISSGLFGAVVLVTDFRPELSSVRPGILMVGFLVPVGLAANTIHTWKQRIRALEREQRAVTQLAVEQERSRIAHDLHDVVTHNVSVMVVQAGAARKVMDTRPEVAREALLAVEAGGRAAMTELRHVMGLLTTNADRPGERLDTLVLAPQPTLDHVPELVRRVRDTGATVDLKIRGVAAPLPGSVELAVYRVVQEGLTNTLKHAAGARVAVVLEHLPDRIRVSVTDTGGTSTVTTGPGGGHGMSGLRERLAMYGGNLVAGPTPAGGHSMVAEIPTAPSD